MRDAEDGVKVQIADFDSTGALPITITFRLPPRLAGLPPLRTAAYCVRRVIGASPTLWICLEYRRRNASKKNGPG